MKLRILFFISAFCLVNGFSIFAFGADDPNIVPTELVSVEDSMKAVLAYSPSLEAIQENRQVILHEVDRAKSGYYPSVDLTGSISYGRSSTTAARASGFDKDFEPGSTVGLQITQTLWNGLAVPNSVDFNIFRLESVDNRIVDNATYLALEAMIAHLDLIRTKEMVILADNNVQTHRSILAKQESLNASGISTGADVSQAQGRLSRAIATYTDALNSQKLAEINYRKLSGKPAPINLGEVSYPKQVFPGIPTAVETAYARNSKILAYQSDIKASRSQIEIAKSANHPNISLSLGSNYSDPAMTKNNQYNWNVGATLGMRWNLFNGGETSASIKSATATSRQTTQELYSVIDNVMADIYNTYENLQTAETLKLTYEEALNYNIITRDNYLSQFDFGTRSLLDVLDAESEVFNTSAQILTVKSNCIVNSWKLLALQGTLLDELGVDQQQLQAYPKAPRPTVVDWK